jgi:D-alanine--poly(phosphoribitol) ligase subunit 1
MDLLNTISHWVEKIPEQKACIHRDDFITYRQLWDSSDALAVWISTMIPDDNSPVIVYGHKQPNMLTAFFGCVKSGHAYIPIDEALPTDRILRIIANSKSKLILSPTRLPEELTIDGSITICDQSKKSGVTLSDIFDKFMGQRPSIERRVKSDDNYYIMYTSGSTGEPKGVQLTLDCLTSFVEWGLSEFHIQDNQMFLNQVPFSFDVSFMDSYLALMSGGTVRCIDKEMIANPRELFKEFQSAGDTQIWVSTPSFAEMCLIEKTFTQNMFPKLHTFLFCGEIFTNKCAQKLTDRFPKATLFNTYGPTEATVAVTSLQVTQKMIDEHSPLPVGYCKPDCVIRIIDEQGRPLPDGEKGEVAIVGPSVSPGYFQNPELSKKVFYVDEYQGKSFRAYKTGDAGYIQNGLVFYCGRLDFQVKLHGYRIELGDIEENLRLISIVKNAVVLPVTKDGKCEYLTAFITLSDQEQSNEFELGNSIKKQLAELLPEYMVPRKIIFKEAMPMNPNGKVNRKKLQEEIQ